MRWFLAVFLIFLLLTTACSRGESKSKPIFGANHVVASALDDVPCLDIADCYTFDQMHSLLVVAVKYVEQFISESFGFTLSPKVVLFIFDGASRSVACEADNRVGNDTAYFYCGSNQWVYIGQDQMWAFYQIGDEAFLATLAHEFAHHVQNAEGFGNIIRTLDDRIRMEDQADCFAGAFLNWVNSRGELDYDEDMEEIDKLLPGISDPEDNILRTHGTLEERADAYNQGMTKGLPGCNVYLSGKQLFPVN